MDNILNKIEKRLKLFHMNKNLDNVIDLNKSGEEQYLDLIRKIIERGKLSYDRHGTRTVSLVGAHMTFNMRNNEFPLLTTTTVSWRSVIDSILWFISNANNSASDTQLQDDVFCDPNESMLSNNSNSTKSNLSCNTDNNNNDNNNNNNNNNNNVEENDHKNSNNKNKNNKKGKDDDNSNISICGLNSNISNNGNSTNNNCNNVSIVRIIEKLRFFIRNARQTNGRRTIITDWNIIDLTLTNAAAFASAYHCLVKFSVIDGELSCHIRQQSADMYYAVPFNIASYALLTYIIAHVADLKLGDLIYTICSAHVNLEHIPFVQKQLNRPPRPFPILNIKRKIDFIEDFKLKDFKIQNYYPWPKPNY